MPHIFTLHPPFTPFLTTPQRQSQSLGITQQPKMPALPSIYLVGVQCQAQDDLASAPKSFFTHNQDEIQGAPFPPPTLIEGAADQIIGRRGPRPRDPPELQRMQHNILEVQAAAGRKVLDQGENKWFISNGSGAEHVVYAVRYSPSDSDSPRIMGAEKWTELRGRMQKALVVLTQGLVSAADAAQRRDRLLGTAEEEGGPDQDAKDLTGFQENLRMFLVGQEISFVELPAESTRADSMFIEMEMSRMVKWVVEMWERKRA